MNIRLRKLLTLLLAATILVILSPASLACSCAYAGKFTEYTSDKGIVRAKIKAYGPKLSHGDTLYESMTVEVIQVIKGQYNHNKLTLLGDPGFLCRAFVDSKRFQIGSEHLLAIANDKDIQPLGGCGESAVAIKGNKVEGTEVIDGDYNSYSVSLHEFLNLLTD